MRFIIPTLLACIASMVVSALCSGGYLHLERAVPLSHRLEMEELRARDTARHARLLRRVVGGVVDYSVQGTSDPNSIGYG